MTKEELNLVIEAAQQQLEKFEKKKFVYGETVKVRAYGTWRTGKIYLIENEKYSVHYTINGLMYAAHCNADNLRKVNGDE